MFSNANSLNARQILLFILFVAVIAVISIVIIMYGVFHVGYFRVAEEPGKPLYNSLGSLTWEAHLELEKCGLSDGDLTQIRNQGSPGEMHRFHMNNGASVDDGTLSWFTYKPGLYQLDCQPPK